MSHMDRFVRKFILLYLVIFNFQPAFSQPPGTKPFFIIVIDEHGKKLDLDGFLNKAIPQAKTGDCNPTWDIFYFRINSAGKVDSLYHDGDLRDDVTAKIISNIYSTETHWKIRKDNKTNEKYWFIFPYFDYGGTYYEMSDCSLAEKKKQKMLLDMAANMAIISHLVKGGKAVLLTASQNGGPIIKL